MIIVTLLYLFLNFSFTTEVDSLTCNQLIEVLADHDTATKTYVNKFKIPVVDKNGKMLFHVNLQRKGSQQKMIINPVRNCRFEPDANVVLTYSDLSQVKLRSAHNVASKNIEVLLDDQTISQLMSHKIISISFEGKKYPYDIILKPNQGRVLQDVVNCIQN